LISGTNGDMPHSLNDDMPYSLNGDMPHSLNGDMPHLMRQASLDDTQQPELEREQLL